MIRFSILGPNFIKNISHIIWNLRDGKDGGKYEQCILKIKKLFKFTRECVEMDIHKVGLPNAAFI